MNQEEAAALALRVVSGQTKPEDLADLHVPLPAVDLRKVDPVQWPNLVQQSVTLPPDVEAFVSGQSSFTQEELDRIEDRLMAYHGMREPYYITAKAGPPFDAWLGFDQTSPQP